MQMHRLKILVVIAAVFAATSCSVSDHDTAQDKQMILPAPTSGDYFNVFVETSAGEHFQQSYNPQTKGFDAFDPTSEHERFLPIPVNEGFIPHHQGPDSSLSKIPVWLLSGRLPRGSIVSTRPLARLEYNLNGQEIESFLMLPTRDSLDYYQIQNFEDFSIRHDATKYAFEYWLRHRRGVGTVSRIRWGDAVEARKHLLEILNN